MSLPRNLVSFSPSKTTVPSQMKFQMDYETSKSKAYYISDLSGYKLVIARQLAALSLHALLADEFTLNDLMKLAKSPKRTIWSKLVQVMNPVPKAPIKEQGTFGVPLAMIVDNYGCETDLEPRNIPNKRIPFLIEEAIRCLQEKDLATEGIFRKNGNIKRLKAFCEECDTDPKNIDFGEDNAIQIAATLKRYFRDLPDPLLTFQLYKVFSATLSKIYMILQDLK